MASDHRSRLSFVIALSIILGSAWVGWWRGQRQDAPASPESTASLAPAQPGAVAPGGNDDAEAEETADEEPLVDDSVIAVEDAPPTDVSAEELAKMLEDMRREQRDGHLLEPIDRGAFAIATRILAVDPENAEARAALG